MGLSIRLIPDVVEGATKPASRTRGWIGKNGATDGVKNRASAMPGDMPDMVEIDAAGPVAMGGHEDMHEAAQATIDRRPGPSRRVRKAYEESEKDGALNAQGIRGPI